MLVDTSVDYINKAKQDWYDESMTVITVAINKATTPDDPLSWQGSTIMRRVPFWILRQRVKLILDNNSPIYKELR